MISYTKMLLFKISTIREELEATDLEENENRDSLDVL